ncbi:MAG: ThuA domain-containing protein, partial [Cyclobacteriaceae bacterium]
MTLVKELLEAEGYQVDTTSDASFIHEDSLKHYTAVVFFQGAGDMLNHFQQADFERFIQSGGGFLGIQAASHAEYGWGWYNQLIGALKTQEPIQSKVAVQTSGADHPTIQGLDQSWEIENALMKSSPLSENTIVVLKQSGSDGEEALSWYQDYDGGRVFYTNIGIGSLESNDNFRKHLTGALQYVADGSKPDYSKAKTLQVPENDRFVKTILVQGEFFEPIELAVLPNLDILVAQRR